jgi:glyoxylase-like metal-dependent hydrolase (beta-lactamase superfamily II)
VLASHEPSNPDQWPPRPEGSPRYRIRALKCGECQVRDYITFYDSKSEDTRTYYLYVFVVEGGAKPIVIETGPKDIASFNKGVEKYIPGGLKQKPDERTPVLLKANGIDPADVSHVFVTHLHADHCEYFDAFPNAQLVVNKPGFLSQLRKVKPWVMEALAKRWPDSLRLVEDEQVLPGIRTMYLDCHSPASQGIVVDTLYGPIVFTGDVAYLYENIETDRHTACPDVEACREAIAKIRHASDLFVPAHDPRLLQRWPEGKIAFPSQESPKQAVT